MKYPGGRRVWLIVSAALAASAVVAVQTYEFMTDSSGSTLLRPDDLQLVSAGSALYSEHCAACHGSRLEGEEDWQSKDAEGFLPAPPHDETGHTWHHPDDVLFEITKVGIEEAANLPGYRTRMPAYADVLSDEEIVAVLSYIKSQWPPEVRARHDQLNQRDRDRR